MRNAVCLGTFDGLHKGHLSVLDIPDGYNKIALIFRIPPKCVKKGITELLLTPEDKVKRLEKMGFSVKILEFEEVEHLSAEDFLNFIKCEFSPALISCGFNYRFGAGGLGDTALLAEFCLKNKIEFKLSSPVKFAGETVSSSCIRQLLREGKVTQANCLLGEDFSFTAEVIHGDGRGKTLGFPTVNQRYPKALVPLKFGVYKTSVSVNGKEYSAITNVGVRPTFPIDYIISETFIKDFEGDLYSKSLKITFKDFLREEKKFASIDDLKIQILKDLGE